MKFPLQNGRDAFHRVRNLSESSAPTLDASHAPPAIVLLTAAGPRRHFLWLLILTACLLPSPASHAQWGIPVPTNPNAQRNALGGLRSQITYFQNSAMNAPNYGAQGYDNVNAAFQSLRGAYGGLKQTLNLQQQSRGANALAELDAGLDIIQEAFANFQNDVAAGRDARVALREMCEVLRQGTRLWGDQLTKVVSQLRIGVG